jgi:hypothetical protein
MMKQIVETFPEIEFYYSAYENDSIDSTPELLQNLNWSFFKDYSIVTEKLDTKKYGPVMAEDRVKNLSIARNKAVEAKDFYKDVDYIMMFESDIVFDISTVKKIINFDIVEPEFDIVSGFTSFMRDPILIYDTWATRTTNRYDNDLHPIDLKPDWQNTYYDTYYTTSNGICLMKAEPFKKGVRYDYINKSYGKFDCETAVLCKNFRDHNYNNIYIIHKALIYHGVALNDSD